MAKLLLANPRRRKTRRAAATKKAPARRRRSTAVVSTTTKVTRRRYRRNPTAPKMMEQVKGAAIGAAGALAVDVAFSKLPIPAQFQTGVMGQLAKGVIALGIGMIASKTGNKKLGVQLADGGLTVALHGAMKSTVGPSIGLAGYDDAGLLGWEDSGLLGFQNLSDDGMGFYSAAQTQDGVSGFQDVDTFDEF